MKKIIKKINLEGEDWYEALIEECGAIITETIYNYRMTLIDGYHQLGKRILEENDNFNRKKIYGDEIVRRISKSLQKGERTIYYAIQFVKKYPDLNKFLDEVEEGKNISWRKVVKVYLPDRSEIREERVRRCTHPELKCLECGKVVKKSELIIKSKK